MGWAKFPLNGGAVNSREPSELRPGEFSEASGVAYKADSERLHNDLVFSDWGFRPSELGGQYDNWQGPFYLNFEGDNNRDWIMLICDETVGLEENSYTKASIFFANANGGSSWIKSDYPLIDNLGNQFGLTNASIAHWGDRYYLVTDQGCAEIEGSGTGTPVVRQLGMLTAEAPRYKSVSDQEKGITTNSMMLLGFGSQVAEDFLGADTGLVSWSYNTGLSDLVQADYISMYVTEVSSDTGAESAPMYYYEVGGSSYWTSDGAYPTVRFPAAFINADSDKFRIYLKYWGQTSLVGGFTDEFPEKEFIKRYEATPVGASLMAADNQYEFAAGDSITFDRIQKTEVTNALPVLGVDGARAIYAAFRHPNTATVCAFWNDALVMNDAGFNNGTWVPGTPNLNGFKTDPHGFRIDEGSPTLIRYSPPGQPWNNPVPYFMNFASEREDKIRGLKVVNDRLVVLCEHAVHTLRYLPFNNLLAAQQGRVKDVVTTTVGLASQKAVAKVDTPSGERCVWLSNRGLEWTDGTGWDDACPDFRVPDGQDLSSAVLVAIPREYRVDLYLGTKLYSFYYHPTHLKEGRLKMLGPTELGKVIYGACEYNGTVYRWDGIDIEWTGADTTPGDGYVYTGFIYGDNPYKDLVIEDFGITHTPVTDSIEIRCDGGVVGLAPQIGTTASITNLDLEETGSAGLAQRGNYVRFRVAVSSADDWSVGPLWVQGDEESGGIG